MSLIRRRSRVVVDGDEPRRSDGSRRARSPFRRLVQGALVVAAGTAALSLAGPLALRPFVDVAGAAGTVTVAFVLDFGGTPANEVAGCVTVPDSANGYDALATFTRSRGLAAPTYAPSGLLCSINGTPSSGCGQVVAGGFAYWSYFTGSQGTWSYASAGASGTMTTGDVEGWRFQDPGSGRPNDPAPRSTAQFASICAATSTSSNSSSSNSSSGSASNSSSNSSSTPAPARSPHGGAASAPVGGSSGPGPHVPRATRARSGATAPGATGGSTSTTSSTSGADGTTSLPDISIPADPVVGVAPVAPQVAPGAGPDPLIVGGLAAAVLAAAAWVRWRKRPRTP